MSRVITLMPVRLAATRLPNKPLAMINDTLVIYSLGNMISAQNGEMKLILLLFDLLLFLILF